MNFVFLPMTSAELAGVNEWEWDDVVFSRPELKSERNAYATHDDSGAVIGYCDFGELAELDPAVFVAVSAGLHPDLRDGGNGAAFMRAIIHHARVVFPDRIVCGAIKHSNPRSLKAARRGGFEVLRQTADGDADLVVDAANLGKAQSAPTVSPRM